MNDYRRGGFTLPGEAGYKIYSTICIIREHNAFAAAHPDARQQVFLSSDPVLAQGETVRITPLEGYFDEQFQLNDSPDALSCWQVWDRMASMPLPDAQWVYADGTVTVNGCVCKRLQFYIIPQTVYKDQTGII